MIHKPPPTTFKRKPATVEEVRAILDQLELERELVRRQRRRNILIGGAALSLLVHLSILWYLDSIRRDAPAGPLTEAVSIEFNSLDREELTALEQPELEDSADIISEMTEMPENESTLEMENTAISDLGVVGGGAMESLGGAGSDSGGMAIGGGGASTSFFGVSGRGTRFAYVVDVSGSMADNLKIQTALRELARSISDLPDYTYYAIGLFSTHVIEPPNQKGWVRSRRPNVVETLRWLENISPMGGTQPLSAFTRILSLEPRPDVIFFMTDGLIPSTTPSDVNQLLGRGKRVVIHTIAFGDASSQELMRQIASDTGGTYRYVSTTGGP